MRKAILAYMIAHTVISFMDGCGSSTNTNGIPAPDKIVPEREVLIENLENISYIITTLTLRNSLTSYMDSLLKMLRRFLNCTADDILMIITFLHKTETMSIVSAIKRLSQRRVLQQKIMLVSSIFVADSPIQCISFGEI